MLLTKIKIYSPDNIVARLSSEMKVHVEIVRCKATGSAGGLSILRIESEPGTTADDIVGWFSGTECGSVISTATISPGRHIVTVRNTGCRLCNAFVGSDCFLESGSSIENDSVIWKIYTPSNKSLKGLIERLRDGDCDVELLSVKKVASAFELTRIQNEAIRLAFSMGYYDIPKRVTLEELASRSGVSKATLNLILRRGQRKILSERLEK
jgi:predicted DNA binding protein